jgi:hypothetical protein
MVESSSPKLELRLCVLFTLAVKYSVIETDMAKAQPYLTPKGDRGQ